MTFAFTSASTSTAHRLGIFTVLAMALGLLMVLVAPAPPADACLFDPNEAPNGRWVNIDSNTRGETAFNYNPCTRITTCNGSICSSSYRGAIRMWGACSPTDCDWGTRSTRDGGDGWRIATYSHGWKTATVWIRPYTFGSSEYVRVWVHHDYHDGRADRTSDNWFVRD